MADNRIKVVLEGVDKSLGKSLKSAGKDANSLSGRLGLVGKILKALVTGHFRQAGAALKTLIGTFGKLGVAAGVAIGAMVVGFYALQRELRSVMSAYSSYLGDIAKVRRMTGLSVESTSLLVGQLKLSGVEVSKGATGFRFFAKNLDAARQGTKAAVDIFKRLHISLKDGNGQWKSGTVLLSKVHDVFSKMTSPIARTALAIKLFGRGGADLLPWLTRSGAELAKFNQKLRDMGLVFSGGEMETFKKYRENVRELGLTWTAFKVSAGAALAPLANTLLPLVSRGLQALAHWMAVFRGLAEKQGLGNAILQMVPGARAAWGAIQRVWAVLKAVWPAAKAVGQSMYSAFKSVQPAISAVWSALGRVVGVLRTIAAPAIAGVKAIAQFSSITLGGLISALGAVVSAVRAIYDAAVSAYNAVEKLLSHGTRNKSGTNRTKGTVGTGVRALGGLVTRPEVSLIGEAGPEAIIPLTKPRRAAEVMAQAGLAGSGLTINFNGDIVGVDANDLARKVAGIIGGYQRRLGRVAV
jgi:hypothetical protein